MTTPPPPRYAALAYTERAPDHVVNMHMDNVLNSRVRGRERRAPYLLESLETRPASAPPIASSLDVLLLGGGDVCRGGGDIGPPLSVLVNALPFLLVNAQPKAMPAARPTPAAVATVDMFLPGDAVCQAWPVCSVDA